MTNMEDTTSQSTETPKRISSMPAMLPQPPQHVCVCPHNAARVRRPRNAFILFRQHQHQKVTQEHPGKTNPELSKIIGEMWRTLPSEEKEYWVQLGDEEKKSHLERFPDYRYQPRRSSKRNGASSFSSNTPMNESGVCAVCKGILPGGDQKTQVLSAQRANSLSRPTTFASPGDVTGSTSQQRHNSAPHQLQQQQQQQQSQNQAPQVTAHGSTHIPPYQNLAPHLVPPYMSQYQHPANRPAGAFMNPPLLPYHSYHQPSPESPDFPAHHKNSAPNIPIYNSAGVILEHRHQSAPDTQAAVNLDHHATSQQAGQSFTPVQTVSTNMAVGSPSFKPTVSAATSASSSISSTFSSLGRAGSQGSNFSRASSGSLSDHSFFNNNRIITPPHAKHMHATTSNNEVGREPTPANTESPRGTGAAHSPTSTSYRPMFTSGSPHQAWEANASAPAKDSETSTFTAAYNNDPSFHKPHTPFTTASGIIENDNLIKRRRTSSYHDPLALRPIPVSRGERYQSAIALAALKNDQGHSTSLPDLKNDSEADSTREHNAFSPNNSLTIRDKVDALALICQPVSERYRNELNEKQGVRGKFIAVEGDNHDMVLLIADLLREKIPEKVFDNGLYKQDTADKRPVFLQNDMALNMWRLSCLHQMNADLDLISNKFAIAAGYVLAVADSLAESGDKQSSNDMTFRQHWMTHLPLLKGLSFPDYLICLQKDQGLIQGEVTVVELQGGTKMLVIGGNKDHTGRIVDKLLKIILE